MHDETKFLYSIEPITADNYRPGMLLTGFVVYYNPHEVFGWTGRRCFEKLHQAEAFADGLANKEAQNSQKEEA